MISTPRKRAGAKPWARYRAPWATWGPVLAGLLPLAGLRADLPPAAPSAPRRLSLAEARRLALEQNWDLLAAKSAVDLATAQKILARQFPNPSLGLSMNKISLDSAHGSRTRVGNDVFSRSYDSIAAVGQLLEIGGKRSARRSSAQAGWEGSEARLTDARRVLELGVTRAYVDVLTADEGARILKESAALLRREAGIAESRRQAGDISSIDRSQIEIAAQKLEVDARQAESDAAQARIRLETLLGQSTPTAAVTPSDSLTDLVKAAAAVTNAPGPVDARPDVRAAAADLRRADVELKLQRSLRVPDPTVQLQYEHEPPDQPHTLGVGVSFPLPLWNRNRGGIAAAEAVREAAAANAAKVAAQAAAEIDLARREYESARSRHEDYVRTIVPQSSSIRETVTFAYQKGGASLLDLLTAQRNDNEVRLNAAQASADVVVARAALAAARNETP